MYEMKRILLATSSSSAFASIGEGVVASCLPRLMEGQKNFLLTDSNVARIYADFLGTYFSDCPACVLPAGEENKSFSSLGSILEGMSEAGLTRKDRLFAVGGGVVGDIGGLAAALYMRGISYVQVPTTLLAQLDSSVGGKTAVDLDGIKNLVGAFHFPSEVVVDYNFLKTLSPREVKCGLGELIKYAALDGEIFDKVHIAIENDQLSDLRFIADMVPLCINYKEKIVREDEREKGNRACLNMGHTTAHVIETSLGLSHGESVLWGMFFEIKLALKQGKMEEAYAHDLLSIVVAALNTPPLLNPDFSNIAALAEKAKSDKKNITSDTVRLSAPKAKGEWQILELNFEEYREGLIEIAKTVYSEKGGGRYATN